MAFQLAYGPGKTLRRELHKRKLVVLGKLPVERSCDPAKRFLFTFRLDREPWWVAEVRPGPNLIWGNDPAFDSTLLEFHLDPNLVRENGYEHLRPVCLFGGPEEHDEREDNPRIIAEHLGLGYDTSKHTTICVPGALLTQDMIGLAVERDGKDFHDPQEIRINKGLIRFLWAARELPAAERPGLENLSLRLSIEPSLLRIAKEHIGWNISDADAFLFAHKMRFRGWNVIVVSRAEPPPDDVIHSRAWIGSTNEVLDEKKRSEDQKTRAWIGQWEKISTSKSS